MADKQIVVKFLGDTKSFDSATKSAIGSTDKISLAFKDLSIGGLAVGAGAAAAGAGIGLMGSASDAAIDFLRGSVAAASDLNETVSKSSVIFGANADAVGKWAEGMDMAGGLSKRAALDAASGFAGLFQTVGIGIDKSAGMSEKLTQMGSDLASFFNTDVGDALDALKSGLNGESEPLRRFNIFLSDAAVQAKAAEMGLVKTNGALTEGQKAAARYALILDQTGAAQGDFARTSDGLANSSRALDAKMENLQARIGQALIPVVQSATNEALNLADALDKVSDGDILNGLVQLGAGLNDINPMNWGLTAGYAELKQKQDEAAASTDALAQKLAWTKHPIDDMDLAMQAADERLGGFSYSAAAAGSAAANTVPPVQSLADTIRGAVSPTKDLDDALKGFFNTLISDHYALPQARDDVATLTEQVANEEAAIKRLNGLHHLTPEQEAELQRLKSQVLDDKEALDQAIVAVGLLDGASVGEITAAFKVLEKDGIDPASVGMGILDDRITQAINHARILARALSGTGGPGGPAPIEGRASGGSAAGLTWVGERGPELLDLPSGSYVYNNAQSMAMARGGPGVVNITINGAQDVQALMRELKRELSRQGMSFA